MKTKIVSRGRGVPDQDVEKTEAFGVAIMSAIAIIAEDAQKQGQPIELHCLLGALTSVLAHYIAGIPDKDNRQRQFGKVGYKLAEQISMNIELGAHAEVYDEKDLQ